MVKAQIFGSFAAGAAGPDSDMDLLATFSGLVSLFDQLRMANELQRISGHPVDVLTEIHPLFSPYIVPTLIPLAL